MQYPSAYALLSGVGACLLLTNPTHLSSDGTFL